ncbi:PTS galactitol transporter subunit IIC [Aerococcus urinae]|uniref:PTS galactitol transporter subunit IIC n=1 Tax=Aerococcus urinae TaxID=1376 RepID=A0A0X8FFP7_9LACT|nr:PTS transporter subunit IIC [Aerococcus urinae]AMB96432.1 PTS galactitol transporter subunit IIC [Aerococcus urinae]MCY3032196.1 PTS galactitol transporter subunit IIC [Aerococcus urinae]MCY3037702.1 PTS galactitol transporter subunit IIC [Aerococcus urinae]MCY3044242.1 PTS galactitol transporter subunit IIC [Aerococcus urinae]MCY3045633.1 PTS galactitol transporter subunit IIC [Aerococcus urinae]
MDSFLDVVQYILGLGPTVIIPIAIFLIALLFKVKVGKAFVSALTIGVGFTGVNLVTGLLSDSLGPATQAMVERFGFSLTVIDIGWPATASGAFASSVAPAMIILALAVNFVMLGTRLTDTLNIDIWNFHHFIVVAALSQIITGNFIFSLAMGVLMEIACLKFADYFAPMIQEYYGLEGISLTTGSSIGYGMLGIPIGWVVSKIPGLKNVEMDAEKIQEKFGIFGQPIIMGLVIGFIIGLLAGYDIGKAFQLGVSMSAVMVLMPRMVKILMEGLTPISEAAQGFADKYFSGRQINIGLDAALAIGNPENMSVGLLLVPITLLIAVILPGNKVLPFGDLATIPFYVCYITASRKGNILHSLITGTIVIGCGLYFATSMAGPHTELLQGLDATANITQQMASLDTGGNFLKWIFVEISRLFAGAF